MSKQQKGLGRGLGALLGDFQEPAAQNVSTLPIQRVEPNPLQPRKDFDPGELEALADSIREHGVIQPLAVRKTEGDYYQIIAGERRWRAARLAGLTEIPVLILEADDRTVMELALIENLQRQDLNPIEEANGYQALITEYGLTQEEAAARVGKSRPAVANSLRLLSLPESLRSHLTDGSISAGHARALLTLKTEALQREAVRKIIALHLSVRQAETLCRRMAQESEAPAAPQREITVDYFAECEKALGAQLGRRVKIVHGKRKGRFELEYYGQEDLETLLALLQSLNRS